MIRETIILFTCIGYISCGFFEDAIEIALYKAIRADETNEPHKGVFENCAPTEADFQITWYPDPLVKGAMATIEGNYTFPEDFESGIADVKCASIFSDSYPVKCKDFWDQPCTKGATAYRKRSMPVPSVVPAGFSFTLTAKLTNDKTGHEIGCAKGNIRIADD